MGGEDDRVAQWTGGDHDGAFIEWTEGYYFAVLVSVGDEVESMTVEMSGQDLGGHWRLSVWSMKHGQWTTKQALIPFLQPNLIEDGHNCG